MHGSLQRLATATVTVNETRGTLWTALLIGVAAGIGTVVGHSLLINEPLGRGVSNGVVTGLLTAPVYLGVERVRRRFGIDSP